MALNLIWMIVVMVSPRWRSEISSVAETLIHFTNRFPEEDWGVLPLPVLQSQPTLTLCLNTNVSCRSLRLAHALLPYGYSLGIPLY